MVLVLQEALGALKVARGKPEVCGMTLLQVDQKVLLTPTLEFIQIAYGFCINYTEII